MVFNHEIIIGPQHRLQNRGKDPAVGVVIVVFSNVIARKEVMIPNLEKLPFSETFWSVEGCDKEDNTNAFQGQSKPIMLESCRLSLASRIARHCGHYKRSRQ